MKRLLFILCTCFGVLHSATPEQIKVLFNSLDPRSVPKHLSFYQLYPDTPEGMKALRHAWHLLSPKEKKIYGAGRTIPRPVPVTKAIISLINKTPDEESIVLSDEELWVIEELSEYLPNRKLKGFYARNEEEVLALSYEEIDLARGLFLSQSDPDPDSFRKLRSYEAMIDLMALQILTKIPLSSPPELKIAELNRFIFDEMGFRFPPQSLYAKDVDLYTFLPSVLDSRRGVCLGVSILYLCLAQRLDLALEMITPPGHIYVRYNDGKKIINIETTARGINLECEVYLSVGTRSLQQRNIKEVIGLAHFNEASVHWQKEDYNAAIGCYQKAQKFVPNDKLIKELLAYNYILTGKKDKAYPLLEEVQFHIPDYAVNREILAEDLLNGCADAECIKAIFMHVDENRSSVLKKKRALEEALEKNPNFRTGMFCLASIWLQLHRSGEALAYLEKYVKTRADDPTTHYYLSVLYAERMNYNKSVTHLRYAEELTQARNHLPKALKEIRKSVNRLYPQ